MSLVCCKRCGRDTRNKGGYCRDCTGERRSDWTADDTLEEEIESDRDDEVVREVEQALREATE
jgi:predicted amidophosphoribosyltransferase